MNKLHFLTFLLARALLADTVAPYEDYEVQSKNSEFIAKNSFKDKSTTIYRRKDNSIVWRLNVFCHFAWLSNDGTHLIRTFPLMDKPDMNYKVFEFYSSTNLLNEVYIKDFVSDVSSIRIGSKFCRWGFAKGFESSDRFAVVTYEGMKIIFDATTGRVFEKKRVKLEDYHMR